MKDAGISKDPETGIPVFKELPMPVKKQQKSAVLSAVLGHEA